MVDRLTRIRTRTGDTGETGLGDGRRVPKTAARIEALGALDELNSHLGLLLAQGVSGPPRELLTDLQHDLFDLGGEVAIPGTRLVEEGYVARLDAALDAMNAALPPLAEFVLPGGNPAAAQCHVARSVCRRAERELLRLKLEEDLNPTAIMYLNRLSDVLFVLARTLARASGGLEVTWVRERRRGSAAGSETRD